MRTVSYLVRALKMSESASVTSDSTLRLEYFPVEILTSILSFDGLTTSLIRLYTAGSRVLNQKLLQSASVVHFESHVAVDWARLPSLLLQLPSLRSLSIDRNCHDLVDNDHTLAVLSSVSSTLEKLVLRYNTPDSLFQSLDFATCFPRLQWLDFGSDSVFNAISRISLPPSLTYLECRYFFEEEEASFEIPASLTSLVLGVWGLPPIAFLQALPSDLESLDFRHALEGFEDHFTLKHVEALPRSLKKLIWNTTTWRPTPAMVSALPPLLETLVNVRWIPGHVKQWSTLHLAPYFLETSQLRQLNRRMEWLSCSLSQESKLQVGDFPPSLTRLELRMVEKLAIDSVSLLPYEHLLTLSIHAQSVSVAFINKLPPKLTHLSLIVCDFDGNEELIRLPPSLRKLKMSVPKDAPHPLLSFAEMPHSLTTLNLEVPLLLPTLFTLPPLLRSLTLSHIDNLLLFQPENPASIERILYVRKVAQEAGFVFDETLPTRAPRTYSVFDLLPRTLSKFSLDDCEVLDAPAWSSLPKNLSTLSLDCPLDPDTLDYLPFDSVTKSLAIRSIAWKDEHVKRLHPRLLDLDCSALCKWKITTDCVPWIPRGLRTWDAEVSSEFNELQWRRADAMESLDRGAFDALNPRR